MLKKSVVISLVVALCLGGAAWLLLRGGSQPAPDMQVTTIKGERVSLAQLRGKVVLVNFWATSCATCVQEMPELARLAREWQPRGVEVVAVAMQYDPPNYVMNYAETRQLPFRVAVDLDGSAATAFGGILGTPTTFVVDPQGRIWKRYLGIPDWSELRQWLETTLPRS